MWWSDYSAKLAHRYTYKVAPVYGMPKNLTLAETDGADIEVTTFRWGTATSNAARPGTTSDEPHRRLYFFFQGTIAQQSVGGVPGRHR